MDEDGERLRDDVSNLIDAFDCIELDEVGNWCQGPVRSKAVNIKEVKDVSRLESLSVLSCYEIEAENDDEGMTTVMGLEEESGQKDEGICDVCLGSVIIGEACVCSVELFGGPRGQEQNAGGLAAGQFQEQDAGGLAAGQMREKVDCMYNIMTEKEGDYLYLEAGTPVSKEGSDVSAADEAWERLGIGVIGPPPNGQPQTSNLDGLWTDGQPTTSERPKEHLTDQAQTWMDEPLPAPEKDQSRTPPDRDQSRTTERPLRTLDQDWTLMDEPPPTSGRTDGQPQPDRRESFEVMALDPGTPESDGEFQAVFENTLGFPTARRPIDSLRRMDTQTPDETIHDWFVGCQVSIGSRLSEQRRKQAERLI